MLVRVKEPRIRIEGDPVPERLISVVRELYGEVEVFKDDDEDLIEIKETRWSQLMDKLMHGGAIVRIRRENAGMTQWVVAEFYLRRIKRLWKSARNTGSAPRVSTAGRRR